MKQHLCDREAVHCTGCTLIYDKETNIFIFHRLDDEIYGEGGRVEFDDEGKPYTEKEEKQDAKEKEG